MGSAIVLFSGGVDSSYLVIKNVNLYEKLFLITYKVPGMICVNSSCKSASQLASRYGDKISHVIIDITDFVYSIRGNARQCIRDNKKYKYFYSWCLGCKLAMHLYTIKLCKEKDITCVLDGSNRYDPYALEQSIEVKDAFRDIYKEHGIDFASPCYDEDEIEIVRGRWASLLRQFRLFKDATHFRVQCLAREGITMGSGFVSQYRQCQPTCTTSLLFNSLRAFLQLFIKENARGYLTYIKDKTVGG